MGDCEFGGGGNTSSLLARSNQSISQKILSINPKLSLNSALFQRSSVDYSRNAVTIPELASLSDREKYNSLMQSREIGDCKTLEQLHSNENPDSFFCR